MTFFKLCHVSLERNNGLLHMKPLRDFLRLEALIDPSWTGEQERQDVRHLNSPNKIWQFRLVPSLTIRPTIPYTMMSS